MFMCMQGYKSEKVQSLNSTLQGDIMVKLENIYQKIQQMASLNNSIDVMLSDKYYHKGFMLYSI